MRKAIFVGLFGICLLGSVRTRAYAQGQTWVGQDLEQSISSAWGRAGALRYNAALQVDSAGYDSDIYFGMLPNRVPDFIFSLGPDLRIFVPLKKWLILDVSDSPRYVFYAKTTRERTLNNSFNGNVHFAFSKLYAQAGAVLVNAKQRLNSELNLNVRVKTDDYSGLLLWQASRQTSVALQYQRSKFTYENLASEPTDIGANLDRTEGVFKLLAYFEQRTKIRLYLSGEYGTYTFAEMASAFRNSRNYGAYAGLEFLPPERGFEGETSGMRGSVSMGYKRLDVIDPAQKDYSGLAGNVAVSLGILRLTALRLFFSRGPQFSAFSAQTYYLQTAYGAGLSRSFSRHIVFTYDFSYSRADYVAAGGGLPTSFSNFTYWIHALRLSFQLRRDLSLSLLSDLGRRNQPSAVRPVSSHTYIGFSLAYGHSLGSFSLPTGPIT